MNPQINYWDLKKYILDEINKNGGWIDCHGHIDRAYTITKENFKWGNKHRHEKWTLNKDLRINSTITQIYDRMAKAIETLISQNVTALATFIDVDPDIKDKSIKAAQKIREKYQKDITIKYLNQSSYGLFGKEERKWFNYGSQFADIIGGLLKADQGREEEHLDILLDTSKKQNKMLHVHIDELNIPEEKETELLLNKIIQHQMQGQVAGIHGISINCHPINYRQKIYRLMQKAEFMMISCPISWLNSRRSETLSPIHNPLTPVDELIDYKIPVGIGSDNIADIFMPLNNADMWLDLRILIEASRCHDIEEIIKIATTNGRKILGIK